MPKVNLTPKVSIITPAYNRENLIEKTILSILHQDYAKIEYLILDDGSADRTLQVVKKYKKKYKDKIRVYSHKNMGEAKTDNRGFELATGEFIMVVNSDDTLYPGAVSASVKFMQKHQDIMVVYPDWDYIDENGKFLSHVKVPEYDYQYMVGYHKCFVGPGAFFRREALAITGGRDPEFRYLGDFDFWLRLGLKAKFARIPKTLATYRFHRSSISLTDQGAKMAAEDIKLIDQFYSLPNLPKKIKKIKKQALSSAHFHAAQISGKNKKKALSYFLKSYIYHPSSFAGENRSNWSVFWKIILPPKILDYSLTLINFIFDIKYDVTLRINGKNKNTKS